MFLCLFFFAVEEKGKADNTVHIGIVQFTFHLNILNLKLSHVSDWLQGVN